ncbi:hypothetical protein GXB85_13095 [Cellulomonas sp. APG4]|uniref:hypothetical protein n=1 Tax=Cellulomonas sp. APG4 TaxID=1538656 RepID=UPI0013798C98|nr:hypothetical protein [Cellulomonas sp. APG4]NCT91881.1 hypothetical protein [Cellulomonas sp. APG4]
MSDRRYGVWFEPEAERYGYGLPVAEPPSEATPALSDAQLAEIEECATEDEVVRAFNFEGIRPGFDYAEAMTGRLSDDAFATSEGRQVFAEWEECLAEHGLQRNPSVSPTNIRGTSLEPSEQNIRVALLDVSCKAEVDFVARLAAIEAELQAPVIAEHLRELEEWRQEYDTALDAARTYLRENAE